MIMSLLVLRVLYVVFNLPAEHFDGDGGDDDGHRQPKAPTEPEVEYKLNSDDSSEFRNVPRRLTV